MAFTKENARRAGAKGGRAKAQGKLTLTRIERELPRVDAEAWAWVKQAIPCPVTYHILYSRWKKACAAVGQPRPAAA